MISPIKVFLDFRFNYVSEKFKTATHLVNIVESKDQSEFIIKFLHYPTSNNFTDIILPHFNIPPRTDFYYMVFDTVTKQLALPISTVALWRGVVHNIFRLSKIRSAQRILESKITNEKFIQISINNKDTDSPTFEVLDQTNIKDYQIVDFKAKNPQSNLYNGYVQISESGKVIFKDKLEPTIFYNDQTLGHKTITDVIYMISSKNPFTEISNWLPLGQDFVNYEFPNEKNSLTMDLLNEQTLINADFVVQKLQVIIHPVNYHTHSNEMIRDIESNKPNYVLFDDGEFDDIHFLKELYNGSNKLIDNYGSDSSHDLIKYYNCEIIKTSKGRNGALLIKK
jgi:hypothetical protein